MAILAPILEARRQVPARRSLLVAITGIDACGKGYFSAWLGGQLTAQGLRVAVIPADRWLNLPDRRFNPAQPAEHFYQHALRFEALFDQLVLPLRAHRSLRCEAEVVEETDTAYRRQVFDFQDLDIILLEGIFLLKPAWRHHYDQSIWLECSLETALERALSRGQEGLPPEETRRAYETIYFPAQALHLARDNPRGAASHRLINDPRLDPAGWR